MTSVLRIGLCALVVSFLAGCSVKSAVVAGAGGFLPDVIAVLEEEEDLELARVSLASDIELIDAMRRSRPKSRKLACMAVQARSSFALGFVESEDRDRAAALYLHAYQDGFSLLHGVQGLREARDARDAALFSQALTGLRPRDFPLFFWSVSAWAGWVNLSRNAPEATSQAPLVEIAIRNLLEQDERFFHAGPHLMAGLFYSSRPAMLGGDPNKGRAHFERCIELTDGKYLLPQVLLAETYAVQVQDRDLFDSCLNRVSSAVNDAPRDLTLLNAIAKERAERLLSRVDELFF